MMNIVINNNGYTVPTAWDEIGLDVAIELQKLVREAPCRVREYFASQCEPSAHEPTIDAGHDAQLLDLLVNIVALMSDVPREELRQTDPYQIADLVTRYLSPFAVSVIFEPVFVPSGMERFEWNGELLTLPRSEMDIEQAVMPFADVTAEQLCQATDLHVAGSLRYAAMIVAVLCRQADEPFSMSRARRRAAGMQKLPMSIVLEVFFCLHRLIAI